MSKEAVPKPISLVHVHRVSPAGLFPKSELGHPQDPLAYLRETQRYIRSLQAPKTPSKPKLRQMLFPGKPALPRVQTMRSKASTFSALRGSKNYAVTRYMLTLPVRSSLSSSRLPAPSAYQVCTNPTIESFLNRFDRKVDRSSMPGITLNP